MFKKRVVSKSNIRQKRPLDSDDKNNSHINALQGGNEVITSTGNGNEEDVREELEEETREDGLAEALALRKLRQQAKSKGVDAMALLTASTSKDGDESAAATAAADSAAAADPLWDLRNGGLVTREMLDQKKAEKVKANISSGFSEESRTMDTDRLMHKYIEQELAKRRKDDAADSTSTATGTSLLNRRASEEDDAALKDSKMAQLTKLKQQLYQIPDNIRVESKSISEGNVTLSAGMLTTIPEVDLGINAKLKNIEATERARATIAETRAAAKAGKSEFDKLVGADFVAAERFLSRKTMAQQHQQQRKKGGNNHRDDHHSHNQPKVNPSLNPNANLDNHASGSGHNRRVDKRTMATDALVMDNFKKRTRR